MHPQSHSGHAHLLCIGKARRHCWPDGTWAKANDQNQTWIDYSECHSLDSEEEVQILIVKKVSPLVMLPFNPDAGLPIPQPRVFGRPRIDAINSNFPARTLSA